MKKGVAFKIDILKKIVFESIFPFEEELFKIDVKLFRLVFKAVIICITFCRFSDFLILKDSDFHVHDEFVEIVFPNSKNDQYFEGTNSIIARSEEEFCPVKLIKLFFKRFNLNFNNANSELNKGKYVNFMISKQAGYLTALTNTRLSQSTSTYALEGCLKE